MLVITLLLPPGTAAAQQLEDLLSRFKIVEEGDRRVLEVSLQDILQLALQRSNAIKVSKIGREIAHSALIVAQERNIPTLTTKLETGRTLSPFSSTFAGSNFLRLSRTEETVISSEWSRKTSSGITYGLILSEQHTSSETLNIANEGDAPARDATTASRTISSTSLKGTVNIPLIQDSGPEVNDIPIRQGEVGVARSQHEVRRDELVILGTVATVYWNLVDILERIMVEQESVKLSERLLNDNRARLRAGVIAPADVKVSETQLARNRQTVLQFQLGALRIEDQLRAALNLEAIEFGYRPIDQPTVRKTRFDFKELAEKMFASNPDLALLNTTLDSNRYDLVEARNQESTDLDLDLFYTFNGYAGSPIGGAADFAETDLVGYGATLTWTLPLFDHVTRQTIQQKILERAQIEVRINDLRSTLSVRLQSSLRSLRLAEKEVETAQISVSLANELMSNEIERFRLGRSTSFRVAEFQQDAAEARRLEIVARVNYEKAFLDMLLLSGDIYTFFELPSGS
ncbi:MAG: TolC family protein [SAR324 cluster bacterium]|nr:TolC family protein [SAR324 cluster bacterium]